MHGDFLNFNDGRGRAANALRLAAEARARRVALAGTDRYRGWMRRAAVREASDWVKWARYYRALAGVVPGSKDVR